MQWRESSQREERDIRYAFLGEGIDEGIVTAAGHVVEVLDTNDLRDFLSLLELPGRDVAEADVTNQSVVLQFGQRSQGLLDRTFRWLQDGTNPEVDDLKPVDTEIPKIVVNAVGQLLTREGGNP